jgi:hypothetical protein
MKFVKVLLLVGMLVSGSFARAADEPVAHLKAVTELMAAMQTEKMMRTITGTSGFPSEEKRAIAFAKLAKVPPAEIYQRLGRQSRRYISLATALEMTHYYKSAYGQKVLFSTYNSRASFGGGGGPVPTAAERKDMARPEFIKAKKEFDEAEQSIRHEGFLLMGAINRA